MKVLGLEKLNAIVPNHKVCVEDSGEIVDGVVKIKKRVLTLKDKHKSWVEEKFTMERFTSSADSFTSLDIINPIMVDVHVQPCYTPEKINDETHHIVIRNYLAMRDAVTERLNKIVFRWHDSPLSVLRAMFDVVGGYNAVMGEDHDVEETNCAYEITTPLFTLTIDKDEDFYSITEDRIKLLVDAICFYYIKYSKEFGKNSYYVKDNINQEG